jgi:peptidoglycan-associated lipoprotein
MKCTKFVKLASVTLLLVAMTGTGCRKNLQGTTPLLGRGPAGTGESPFGIKSGKPIGEDQPIPLSGNLSGWTPAADQPAVLRDNVVYFEYDRSQVKASEHSKLDAIASFMKSGNRAVRVEGHCDERGTEEYNRSLGERRALAAREYLVRAGVPADRLDTISHGEDKPAVPGHNEAAWSKNRRAEFVLLQPPSGVGATGPQ